MCVRETFDYYHIITQYRQRLATSSEQLDTWLDEQNWLINRITLHAYFAKIFNADKNCSKTLEK